MGQGDSILIAFYFTLKAVQIHYPLLLARVQQELADHLPDDRSPMDGLREAKLLC